MSDNLKKWLPWIAAAAVALVVIVVVAVANGSDDSAVGDTSTTVAAETPTTTVEGETATTIPETTTTLTPETTTTGEVETTTTAEVETTTTTTPATTTTSGGSGTVELSDEGVDADSEWVPFGTIDEDAISSIVAALGPPTHDSGWVDSFSVYGTCPGTVVRGVHWDAFIGLFTQADTDFWTGGVPHFFAYYYTELDPELRTSEGITIGSSLNALNAAYGGPLLVIDENPFDPSTGFWAYDINGWTGLWGFATGQNPADVITSVNGGLGCGE